MKTSLEPVVGFEPTNLPLTRTRDSGMRGRMTIHRACSQTDMVLRRRSHTGVNETRIETVDMQRPRLHRFRILDTYVSKLRS